ncbi:MAG: hypothetical protein KGL25_08050, partial [Gammaproteobacteria bacterium]|nr:hypothetical protein [Gammaproteobacteria bacterium]
MPEPGRKRCLVAIDAATGPLLLEVELEAAASVAEALGEARAAAARRSPQCALEAARAIDRAGAATGIWGLR